MVESLWVSIRTEKGFRAQGFKALGFRVSKLGLEGLGFRDLGDPEPTLPTLGSDVFRELLIART